MVCLTAVFHLHSLYSILLNGSRMIMNYDLKRMWEELVMARFKVTSQHLPGGTEENYEKPWGSWQRF
jgi:hypothetical protein